MPTHLIRKLELYAKLSTDEKHGLEEIASKSVRSLDARQDLIREGDKPKHVNLLLEGFAARYKTLVDGRIQIISLLLPGDMCDLRMLLLRRMDHSIGALSRLKVAQISEGQLHKLTSSSPRLERALAWNSLVDEAISREWTVNVGRREALERMAHLFCEVYLRLRGVGLAENGSCELPLTQAQLGDALGISGVHVNRTLMELRGRNLIELRGKTLVVRDLERLKAVALFNPDYLHFDRDGREFDSHDSV